jgi:putative peptidoglycan lipid II flippase
MVVIALASVVALVLFGQPALGFVFGVRSMSDADVRLLWVLMLLLAGCVAGDATGNMLLTSFYATGDTGTPTKVGMAVYTVGIVVKLGGFWFFGIFGIAAATSLTYLLRSVVLHLVLRHRTATAIGLRE